MNDHETSPNEAVAIFNITSPSLIRKWRRIFNSQGLDALESKKKGRPSIKKETRITQSMSRKRDYLVNAVIESFFGLLKS